MKTVFAVSVATQKREFVLPQKKPRLWIEHLKPPEVMSLPGEIETCNGREYPSDHVGRFVKLAMRNHWSMPLACHVFDRTLVDLAMIWTDSIPRRSILHFADLEDRLMAFFKPAISYAELFLEVHNIKQHDEESTEAFLERYERETSRRHGLGDQMRISGLIQGLEDRDLLNFLHGCLLEDFKSILGKAHAFLAVKAE